MMELVLFVAGVLLGYWLGCNRDLAKWLPDWNRNAGGY